MPTPSSPQGGQRKLRAVDNERPHPRDFAVQAIKRRRAAKYPITNQHDTGAPTLPVDDVLQRSGPEYLVGKGKPR